MIDKENEVYTAIRTAILEKFPKADVSSMYIRSPAGFPHISVVQTDSYEPKALVDSSLEEKYTTLAFQIDVYSDNETQKKTECKKIMQIVDETLRAKNFRREAMTAVPNIADDTIYRLTAKYIVTASSDYFYRS